MNSSIKSKYQELIPTGSFFSSVKLGLELFKGFKMLKKYPPISVTVYGSARDSLLSERDYQEAENVGRMCAERNITLITGAGSGMMLAANKGCFEAGGNSLGARIDIPSEPINEYLTDYILFQFLYTRKAILAYQAEAFIFLPGGYGTLDELTEIITQIKIKRMPNIPIVLVGKEFWTPFYNFLKNDLADKHMTIDNDVDELMVVVDTAEEAFKVLDDKCQFSSDIKRNFYLNKY